MASTFKLKLNRPIDVINPAVISTYYLNDSAIFADITGWNAETSITRYKFIVTGTGEVGGSMTCAIYKNNSHKYNVTIPTTYGDGTHVFGNYDDIIDSIDINITVNYGSGFTYTEDFDITPESTTISSELITLELGDVRFESSERIAKVILRNGSGDHKVFQEQMPIMVNVPMLISKTSTSITFRYYVPSDSQDNVKIVGGLNKSPYASQYYIATNIAPGTAYDFTWTGLSPSTQYRAQVTGTRPETKIGLLASDYVVSAYVTTDAGVQQLDWEYVGLVSSTSSYVAYLTGSAEDVLPMYDEMMDWANPNDEGYNENDLGYYENENTQELYEFKVVIA